MSSNATNHDMVKKVEYDTVPTLGLGVFAVAVALFVIGSIVFVWWLLNWRGGQLLRERGALTSAVLLDSNGQRVLPGKYRDDNKKLVISGGTDRYFEEGKWKTEQVQPIAQAFQRLLTNPQFIETLPGQAPAPRPVAPPAPRRQVAPAPRRQVAPAPRPVAPRVVPRPAPRPVAPAPRVVPRPVVPAPRPVAPRPVVPVRPAPARPAPARPAPVRAVVPAPAKRTQAPAPTPRVAQPPAKPVVAPTSRAAAVRQPAVAPTSKKTSGK